MMRWLSYLVMRGVVWVTRLLFADINISFSTALHRSKARLGGFFSLFIFVLFLFPRLFVNLSCCLSHYSVFPRMRLFFITESRLLQRYPWAGPAHVYRDGDCFLL